jgi:hypothetical protein
MMAVLLDLFGEALVARHVKKVWLLLLVAAGMGILSSVLGNLLTYALGMQSRFHERLKPFYF